jgi:predicted kinase
MPTMIVLCGLPASGKTTLAKQIAASRPALRFTPDDWFESLGFDLWDEELRAKVEALQLSVASSALECGVDVVIDFGSWGRSERDALRAQASELGASFELHYLEVSRAELWRRTQERNTAMAVGERRFTEGDLDDWIRVFQVPGEEELPTRS